MAAMRHPLFVGDFAGRGGGINIQNPPVIRAWWPYAGIQTGRFVLSSDQNLLRRSQSSSRGSGGMLPRENFGKKELNLAILCILGVKQWLQYGLLTKKCRKSTKNIFSFVWADICGRAGGFFQTPQTPLETGLTNCWPNCESSANELSVGGCVLLPWTKKKNHHRDSRREERRSTCDIMLDQARAAQGRSDPRLSTTFALRCSRLIEHDITRGTAFFSPRISRMVLFFVKGSNFTDDLILTFHMDWKRRREKGERGGLGAGIEPPAATTGHPDHLDVSRSGYSASSKLSIL